MKKPTVIIGLIIIALIVVVAVFTGDNSEVTQEDTVTIGFIGPLTGEAAEYGEPFQKAGQLAIDEINENGGVNGAQVEGIFEDGKCTGADAASAANKLVNVDNVEVIVGGFCSGESLAAVPIAEAQEVLLISPGSSSPDLTGISDYFARTYPSDSAQGEITAELADERGWNTVAFIQEQTDYAAGIYEAFNSAFTELGGETVRESFGSEQTDFRTALTKLENEQPDALFVSVQSPAAGERVLRQLSDLQWDVPLLVSDAIAADEEVVERNADLLEGALAATFSFDDTRDSYNTFKEAYENQYDESLRYSGYTTTAYDTVHFLADGIAEVGYDGQSLATWVRSADEWSGASGTIDIKENGDPVSGHAPFVIEDGELNEL